ncbi:MAG: AbgT family transporter [Bdellovibrionaceae bacterium]|nr:AbgT family transporter [Pseudobdellovibrionaceae bacterium]MDW8190171.1 AbgT family transporter [Pseudobdellovibrionaceae bacterium]
MRLIKSLYQKFLDWVEKIGNRFPDPAFLFAGIGVVVIFLSWLCYHWDVSVIHPLEQKTIVAQNLLQGIYLQKMLTDAVKNFAAFPPLATVLVTMVGVAVAEKTGFIAAALRAFVLSVPSGLLTSALVFAGVMSSMAADAGYVVLTPLGAVLFASLGRHPLAGLAAVFAGVSGGYSANLFLTSLDPLLAGLTTKAAQLVDPNIQVAPSANYYFMAVSTVLLTILGTWVTRRLVEPRLGTWSSSTVAHSSEDPISSDSQGSGNGLLTAQEKKALAWSLVTGMLWLGVVLYWVLPKSGVLRDEAGELKPLYDSLVTLMMLGFLLVGLVYGLVMGSIRSTHDVTRMMSDYLATLSSYIVLSFFAAQMLAYFQWSNLGIIMAVKGAQLLQSLALGGIPLFFFFIAFVTFINLFMGSASAKWAMMAPVFVPMFMLAGYPPDVTQAAYRVGDSVTNMISPLLPYFPIILAVARKYQPGLGLGTLLSLMLPYAITFGVGWVILFSVWLVLGLPFGF